MKTRTWTRNALSALALALFVQPALATWSIVVVNTKTGEVCVASATCVGAIDLERFVPVIQPGRGGGAAQSVPDVLGTLRREMWDGFRFGKSPEQILDILSTYPAHQSHQFGIVDMLHDPVTFSGQSTGAASNGVAGISGNLRYAIQGNVLAGYGVVLAAEDALLSTPGDLGQRVMAGMLAARNEGGDGRCSCSPQDPTACGEPPPAFDKAAQAGFIALARVGDFAGKCNTTVGCAAGAYYLNLEFYGKAADPDPVFALESLYAAWRIAKIGQPDHLLSRALASKKTLVPNGVDAAQVTLVLRDLEETRIEHGGHAIELELLTGSDGATHASSVVDRGNGTYTFALTGGTQTGTDRWRVRVGTSDGSGAFVTLQPDVEIRVGR